MKVTYRHATVADIPAIVNLKLAPKDAQEALDGSGCSSTRSALAKCLEISKVTWVIEDSSGIIGVFGLGSTGGSSPPVAPRVPATSYGSLVRHVPPWTLYRERVVRAVP